MKSCSETECSRRLLGEAQIRCTSPETEPKAIRLVPKDAAFEDIPLMAIQAWMRDARFRQAGSAKLKMAVRGQEQRRPRCAIREAPSVCDSTLPPHVMPRKTAEARTGR